MIGHRAWQGMTASAWIKRMMIICSYLASPSPSQTCTFCSTGPGEQGIKITGIGDGIRLWCIVGNGCKCTDEEDDASLQHVSAKLPRPDPDCLFNRARGTDLLHKLTPRCMRSLLEMTAIMSRDGIPGLRITTIAYIGPEALSPSFTLTASSHRSLLS